MTKEEQIVEAKALTAEETPLSYISRRKPQEELADSNSMTKEERIIEAKVLTAEGFDRDTTNLKLLCQKKTSRRVGR